MSGVTYLKCGVNGTLSNVSPKVCHPHAPLAYVKQYALVMRTNIVPQSQNTERRIVEVHLITKAPTPLLSLIPKVKIARLLP